MRINKGYWVWGLFPSKEKFFLNQIKAEVQNKLKSPFFETHITLSGPYLNIENIFLNKLKTFAKNNTAIMLSFEKYNFEQEIFKSFYIQVKESIRLKELRRNLYELNKFDEADIYFPHISLSYGNHEIKEKKELISKLPELNKPIKMSKIALVEVDEAINLWKILKTFDFNEFHEGG